MKHIPFGHVADTTDEHEYDGNIVKRRSQRCQCDSGLTHGTCPGPDNCPYSDRAEEEEIKFVFATRSVSVEEFKAVFSEPVKLAIKPAILTETPCLGHPETCNCERHCK